MIRMLEDAREALAFAEGFDRDPVFHDPMLLTPEMVRANLVRAIRSPAEHRVFAVVKDGVWTGLFSFLTSERERYLEMLAGLSRDAEAYDEMLSYLRSHFAGYQADFVFCPRNRLLGGLLERAGARFEAEQKKLARGADVPCPPPCGNVAPFSERYREAYLVIHDDRDRYWTGEKVLAAPETFRVLLALAQGRVVGYMDVTRCYDENEPYDLFVLPAYRRRGLGRALASEAVRRNHPKGMTVLVDAENKEALSLYRSLGFAAEPMGDNLTARLCL